MKMYVHYRRGSQLPERQPTETPTTRDKTVFIFQFSKSIVIPQNGSNFQNPMIVTTTKTTHAFWLWSWKSKPTELCLS